MPANLLTDRKVATAKPKEKEYLLSDGEGLALRIRPDGSRLWLYRYTSPAGKPAKKSLGPYPSVGLADARKEAARLRERRAKGIDPNSTPEDRPDTVRELFNVWVRDSLKSRRNARGIYAATRRMEANILAHAENDRIDTMTKARAMGLLDKLVSKGRRPQANCVLIDLKQMFDFAVARDWLDANPVSAIKKTDVGGKDVVRDRVLRAKEIVLLRDKLAQPLLMTLQAEAGIWIALSTLTRAGEVTSVEDTDIDWEAREWHLPAAKNKSKRDHLIHLSDFAFYWLQLLRQQARPGRYLMPGKMGKGHLKYNTIAHQLNMRQESQSNIQGKTVRGTLLLPGGRWTVHDLRRTGATMMGEMGIAENVVEKCLNHAESSKLVKVYQRQQLLEQRREAFDMLGAKLTQLLGDPHDWGPGRLRPDNVVELRRTA